MASIKNNAQWNDFLIQNNGSFLQNYEWGEFQEGLGRKIWKLKNNFWQALIIKHNLPFGKSYLYCPRGPILAQPKSKIKNQKSKVISEFLEEVKKIAKEENTIFFRVDPEWKDNKENRKILMSLGFQKSKREIQPKSTLILDLTKSEKELISQMHPKTRYNIHLAQRHRIKVRISNKDFEVFWELLQETAKRDKFRLHLKEHYQKLLGFITGANLFLTEYQRKIIAANIVVFFGKKATYIHGATDYRYRNLMAPHFLQWKQILEAKKLGCQEYDFWGIDEKRWPGLTRFKKSFGGQEVNYIGAYDFVFQPLWHKLYNLAR